MIQRICDFCKKELTHLKDDREVYTTSKVLFIGTRLSLGYNANDSDCMFDICEKCIDDVKKKVKK